MDGKGHWKGRKPSGRAAILAHQEPTIWCWIRGGPLRRGEDFAHWRIRAVRVKRRNVIRREQCR